MRCKLEMTDKQGGAYLGTCNATSSERSVTFIKLETKWYMMSSDFHFQFNTTIDLYCTLIGHFRALYQMYLSLRVDTGQGGSPNHRQI